jgi:hypothetical protein
LKILDIFGREVKHSLSKYLVDWEGKSLSKVQWQTKQFLKPFWQRDVVTEEYKIKSSLLSCDLLNWSKKIAVEIDGNQHLRFNDFFHKDRAAFLASVKRDEKKDLWLEKMGFASVRIHEKEVKLLTKEWFLEKFGVEL